MNTMLVTTVVLGVVGVLAAVVSVRLLREHDLSGWGIILGFVAAAALIGFVAIPAFVYGGRAAGRVSCRNWGRQTGRPVKFVAYTSWDEGNCLTRDINGKWISTDQLRQFGSGR